MVITSRKPVVQSSPDNLGAVFQMARIMQFLDLESLDMMVSTPTATADRQLASQWTCDSWVQKQNKLAQSLTKKKA